MRYYASRLGLVNFCDGIWSGSDGIRIWALRGTLFPACVWCLLLMGSDGVRGDVMWCIMLLAWVWCSLCDGIPTGSEGDRSGPRVEVLHELTGSRRIHRGWVQ